MFTVYAKHFIYGTQYEDMSTEAAQLIIQKWATGEDIIVQGKRIPNKYIESVRLVKKEQIIDVRFPTDKDIRKLAQEGTDESEEEIRDNINNYIIVEFKDYDICFNLLLKKLNREKSPDDNLGSLLLEYLTNKLVEDEHISVNRVGLTNIYFINDMDSPFVAISHAIQEIII